MVAPLTSCRRQVAESMIRIPWRTSASASRLPVTDATALLATVDRSLRPSMRWFAGNNFETCAGEHVMTRLEGAVRWWGRQAEKEEMELPIDKDGDQQERGGGRRC